MRSTGYPAPRDLTARCEAASPELGHDNSPWFLSRLPPARPANW